MTRLFNKQSEKEKRRSLRNTMPLAEKIVWNNLRKRELFGIRFLRQYSIDYYVLDFYSPKIKLAIEIDGDSHLDEEAIEYDKNRQEFIESVGIKVIRFRNEEVYGNIDKVIEEIEKEVKALTPPFCKGGIKGG